MGRKHWHNNLGYLKLSSPFLIVTIILIIYNIFTNTLFEEGAFNGDKGKGG